MTIEPLGDASYILRDMGQPAFQVAAWLSESSLPGLLEAVASYDTVGLYVESDFDPGSIQIPEDIGSPEPRRYAIPVCYEMGPDLETVAQRLQLTPEQVIAAHSLETYTCYAVGFCPGFGYLGYLPELLQGVPRLPQPRVRVEAGCVGITGNQTAVYPLPRPGGWSLIGKTPLTLVDVADAYFPLRAGDLVTFQPVGAAEYESLKGERL